LASSHRFVHAMMALEAGWLHTAAVPARTAFRTFAADVEKTLDLLAAALRGTRVQLKEFPDLREDHHVLLQSGDQKIERYAVINGAVFVVALFHQYALVEVAASILTGLQVFFLSSAIGDLLEQEKAPNRVRNSAVVLVTVFLVALYSFTRYFH